MLESIESNLSESLRRLGVWDATLYLCARALSKSSGGRCVIFSYRFYAQPVPDEGLPGTAKNGALRVARVSAGHLICAQFPRPQEVIARRFDDGAVCHVAFHGGRFAGFIWLQECRYNEDEVRCDYILPPDGSGAWDYDVYVEPDFRLGRCFVRLWEAANAYLRGRGVCWSFSRISAFNPESLASHRRLGVRQIGRAHFVRCGAVELALLSVAPFIHLSLSERSRPSFRLKAPRGEGKSARRAAARSEG